MLLLAMLLQTAATPDPDTGVLPNLPGLAGVDCADLTGCEPDPGRRYRLDVQPAREASTMQRAMRGVWKPCGTTGAPVCPTQPHLLFRAELDPK